MVYLAFVVLVTAIVVVAYRRLVCWQDPRPTGITGCRPPNQWTDVRSWMTQGKISWTAFHAMSPPEKESLRRLMVNDRAGPPELYLSLALEKKSYVLVIAANTDGYIYSALDGDEVPEPEQINDLAKWYNCPVFLARRDEMLS